MSPASAEKLDRNERISERCSLCRMAMTGAKPMADMFCAIVVMGDASLGRLGRCAGT